MYEYVCVYEIDGDERLYCFMLQEKTKDLNKYKAELATAQVKKLTPFLTKLIMT